MLFGLFSPRQRVTCPSCLRESRLRAADLTCNAAGGCGKAMPANYREKARELPPLFVPIWAARKLLFALGIRVRTENAINTALINRVLTQLFRADVKYARRLRAPFGVSLCAVGVKAVDAR